MSNSIVYYHGRDDSVHIIDPDALPHFNELPPLFDIVVAVINAGYKGVVVDLSVNQGTPEGQIIQELAAQDSKQLPSIKLVLEQIEKRYTVNRGHYE